MTQAFRIDMSSAQEVGTGSTSTATGLGIALLYEDEFVPNQWLEYTITVRGLDWGAFTGQAAQTPGVSGDDVTDAHFHEAAAGANGPVRFGWKTHDVNDGDAYDDEFTVTGLALDAGVPVARIHGKWEVTDPLLVSGSFDSFAQDVVPLLKGVVTLGSAAPFYANIHSSAFPGGDIRGQLTLLATEGDDTIYGTDRDDVLPGLNGDDTIYGLGGNDTLDGRGHFLDTLIGGPGNDTYICNDSNVDRAIELVGEGFDWVKVIPASHYTLEAGSEIELLTYYVQSEVVHINLSGNEFNNIIQANAGNNVLNGGAGIDTMYGFAGNDTYIVDNAFDRTVDSAGQGNDRVQTSVTYGLEIGREIELLETTNLFGTTAINLIGNEFANGINGNSGNNVLIGGAGNDQINGWGGNDTISAGTGDDFLEGHGGNDILNGGAGADVMRDSFGGNDTYQVDDAGDRVIDSGGGSDRVNTSVSYALQSDSGSIELMVYTSQTSTAAINLTGNGSANTIQANNGDNIIDGGGGGDRMFGFAGNDTYIVDRPFAGTGDYVFEGIGQGNDRVLTSATYRLEQGREIETLATVNPAGTSAIDLTGNEFGNTLEGNAGANTLYGYLGIDTLAGGGGNDTYIIGNPYKTYIPGNPPYDNSVDHVVEAIGGGSDQVKTWISYALEAGSEIETLLVANVAFSDIDLTGNEFANSIQGSDGNNRLDGGGGTDIMFGFAGNDTYIVDNAADRAIEGGGGNDRVNASVSYALEATREIETLATTDVAGTAAINLTGNEFGNTIEGNAGSNTLDGRGGIDVLSGFGGDDTFIFRIGQAGGDTVSDFVGNGAAAGDLLRFIGYGAGATFTNIDATHWQVNYNGNTQHEIITFSNGAPIHASDYLFV